MSIPKLSAEELLKMPQEQRDLWMELVRQDEWRHGEIKRLTGQGEFGQALALCDSQERARTLLSFVDVISDQELRELMADWWSSTEAWQGDPTLRRGMMWLLQRVAPVIVDPNKTLPTDSALEVYRGNMGERPGAGSWTLDPEIAEKFASAAFSVRAALVFGIAPGLDDTPTVWKGYVLAEDVWGYFDDRGEREVVVGKAPIGVTKLKEAS